VGSNRVYCRAARWDARCCAGPSSGGDGKADTLIVGFNDGIIPNPLDGIVWASLGGSGHLARFDRSKCRQTWGAGDQCAEGWTLYRSPGPLMRTGSAPNAEVGADFHYYLFVDQFDTLGLGKDVVVMNGTGSDPLAR
jgi:hypothetical protein